jgi:hypothetical protein
MSNALEEVFSYFAISGTIEHWPIALTCEQWESCCQALEWPRTAGSDGSRPSFPFNYQSFSSWVSSSIFDCNVENINEQFQIVYESCPYFTFNLIPAASWLDKPEILTVVASFIRPLRAFYSKLLGKSDRREMHRNSSVGIELSVLLKAVASASLSLPTFSPSAFHSVMEIPPTQKEKDSGLESIKNFEEFCAIMTIIAICGCAERCKAIGGDLALDDLVVVFDSLLQAHTTSPPPSATAAASPLSPSLSPLPSSSLAEIMQEIALMEAQAQLRIQKARAARAALLEKEEAMVSPLMDLIPPEEEEEEEKVGGDDSADSSSVGIDESVEERRRDCLLSTAIQSVERNVNTSDSESDSDSVESESVASESFLSTTTESEPERAFDQTSETENAVDISADVDVDVEAAAEATAPLEAPTEEGLSKEEVPLEMECERQPATPAESLPPSKSIPVVAAPPAPPAPALPARATNKEAGQPPQSPQLQQPFENDNEEENAKAKAKEEAREDGAVEVRYFDWQLQFQQLKETMSHGDTGSGRQDGWSHPLTSGSGAATAPPTTAFALARLSRQVREQGGLLNPLWLLPREEFWLMQTLPELWPALPACAEGIAPLLLAAGHRETGKNAWQLKRLLDAIQWAEERRAKREQRPIPTGWYTRVELDGPSSQEILNPAAEALKEKTETMETTETMEESKECGEAGEDLPSELALVRARLRPVFRHSLSSAASEGAQYS